MAACAIEAHVRVCLNEGDKRVFPGADGGLVEIIERIPTRNDRTATGARFNFEGSATVFNELAEERKAETDFFAAGGFGGHEGVSRACEYLWGHATAIVSDRERETVAYAIFIEPNFDAGGTSGKSILRKVEHEERELIHGASG